ncbi:unnamed protein product [Pedinophyceae sp. YPF-701]|nr:unnamed protein product [Pedinophyceae sp. YPF-701]
MFGRGLGPLLRWGPRPGHGLHRGSARARASSASGGSAAKPSQWAGIGNSAVTSGSLAIVGDAVAQTLEYKWKQSRGEVHKPDAVRGARLGVWGLLFYGPLQHFWYRLLDRGFPGKSTGNFLSKVTLNQLILGPVVLSSVFAWTLTCQGKAEDIPGKIRRDLLPSAINGWKFWVPAACVNFWLIPLKSQVLYMSTCGIVWSAYLSFTSNNRVVAEQPAARK